MEANDQIAQENTAPEFEQQIEDTRVDRANTDTTFEQNLGLPIEPNDQAPPTVDTQQHVEHPASQPKQDFSKQEVAPEGNDQVRYQYWQSQAAKLQNQLNEYKGYQPMVDYLRANPEAVQSLTPGGQLPEEPAPTSQEPEAFPPPPAKPEQPHGFSREEAFSDPSSESARYLNAVDAWRDDMQTYNSLHSQYEIAKVRETYETKIDGLEKHNLEQQQARDNAKQMQEIRSHVGQNYDLGDRLDDFISTMNDPKSINMDDLVGYYKYKNGMAAGNIPAPQAPIRQTQPSPAFNQTRRAQSVPAPMGVQPASANAAPSSGSSNFMDSLINDHKNKNIL
jgi:hypothetical protein